MNKSFLTISLLFATFSLYSQDGDTIGNQKAWYQCNEPLSIDSAIITVKRNEVYFDFHPSKTPEKPKKEGFSWLVNYPEEYFVSYLVNTSTSIFGAKRQDASLIMIQEAMDQDGNWKPIEYWVHSGCGNSYFDPLSLPPGQAIFVPIKKYSGSFKTNIRLKFKYSDKIMYSEPFEGSIDPTQFVKEKNSVRGILYTGPANYLEPRK